MGRVLTWIKGNPLTVACLAVILIATLSFYYPTYVQGSAFRREMSARQSDIDTINQYKRSQMQIPPSKPDDPPTVIQGVINDEAIAKLKGVYDVMEKEYVNIYRLASGRNLLGHDVMLKGIFPTPLDEAKPFDAQREYTRSFEMLYQLLHAGSPPSATEIEQMMKDEEEAYKRKIFPIPQQLSTQQQDEIKKNQAKRLFEVYQKTAAKYHVYAAPVVINVQRGEWNRGIFQIGDWAKPGPKPDMFDIWEGQMQLWIQQDLVAAIRIANDMDDASKNLTTLPIKRILAMFVKPGYVGVPSSGYTAPQDQGTAQRLADDFSVSPTGRHSNPIYDVRHAVLSVIVDSKQIPKLLNAISQVNFMTVIGMSVRDVDGYEALKQGYFYGNKVDVVQLDLTIETIWLRSWTAGHLNEAEAAARNEPFNAGLMPDDVRYYLGLPTRTPADKYIPPASRSSTGGGNAPTPGAGGEFAPPPGGGGLP
ncbi:MAG: hypothetical protein GC162_05505 [Planctomycetes bacterium]|nr:hypothetical protein [Planctomycetota bacterium]